MTSMGVGANAWCLGQPAAVLVPPPPSAPSTLLRAASAHHQLTSAASSLLRAGSLPRRPVAAPPRENLVCKLSDLKDKVDWLAEEMAKLGDKRKEAPLGHR